MWTEKNIPEQNGAVAIITGANSGIGYKMAKALYSKGAHVILACRDRVKAHEAIDRIKRHVSGGQLDTALLDLSSLASVNAFAEQVKQEHKQVHLLINNAGVMTPPKSVTADGYELQFGVNFLGHFALTARLYPVIRSTVGARIVTITSLAYLQGSIDFANLRSERSYEPFREYCQSKLADLLFTVELQRRINACGDNVLSVAAHPGVTKTELSRHMTASELEAAIRFFGNLMDATQGALPGLYAAVAPTVIAGGLYGPDADGGLRGYPAFAAVDPAVTDSPLRYRLWQEAESLTGLTFL